MVYPAYGVLANQKTPQQTATEILDRTDPSDSKVHAFRTGKDFEEKIFC